MNLCQHVLVLGTKITLIRMQDLIMISSSFIKQEHYWVMMHKNVAVYDFITKRFKVNI